MTWLLLLLVSLVAVPPLQATTYWVSATLGSPTTNCATASGATPPASYIRTIITGIRCLAAGDTLFIRAGTYAGDVDTNSGTFPDGGTSFANAPLISAYPGGVGSETVTIQGYWNLAESAANPSTGYLIFQDLTFVGPGGCCGSGISLQGGGVHHIRLLRLNISGYSEHGITGFDSGTGLPLGHEILNCHIHHNGTQAGSHNNKPDDFSPYVHGIYLYCESCLFEGNTINNSYGYGIHLYSAADNNINNTIIRNNIFHTNGQWVDIQAPIAGLIVTSGDNNQVYNNVFYNEGTGIQIQDQATNTQVYNNTFVGMNGGNPITIQASATTPILVRNNIFENPDDLQDNHGGVTYSNNLCRTSGTGCNVIDAGGPDFVSAGTNNYRLLSTSSAIDTGTTGIFGFDFDGVARPQDGNGAGGAQWDIGAFEFVASDLIPPSDVTGLTATTLSSTVIQLNGYIASDASGIGGFHTERCTGVACNSSFTNLGTLASGPQNNTGLTPGTVYGYRMKAVDASPAANESVNWYGPIYATTFAIFPDAPTGGSLSMATLTFPAAPTAGTLALSSGTPPAAPTGGSLSMPALSFPTAPTGATLGVAP